MKQVYNGFLQLKDVAERTVERSKEEASDMLLFGKELWYILFGKIFKLWQCLSVVCNLLLAQLILEHILISQTEGQPNKLRFLTIAFKINHFFPMWCKIVTSFLLNIICL